MTTKLLTLRDVMAMTALVTLGHLRTDGRVAVSEADPGRQPRRPLGRAGSGRLHRQPPPRRLRPPGRLAETTCPTVCNGQAVGLGLGDAPSIVQTPMAWKSGTRHENPTSKPQSPRSMQPVPPRTTGPDIHDRGARTTTDHSARTTTANGTTTTLGPGTRTTAADENGATSSQRNPAALENLAPLTRSEMTSARTTETAHGNRWLLSCRWQEPADPMCVHWGWRGGATRPLRTPGVPRPCGSRGRAGRRAPARSWRCAHA